MSRPQRPGDRRGQPPSGLFAEILFDAERDHCPGAAPVVSIATGDDADYRRAVAERALVRALLRRRGVEHGEWAALRPDGIVPKIQGRKRRIVAWRMRWNAARPIVLPGLLEATAAAWRPAAAAYDRLFEALDPALDPMRDRALDRARDTGPDELAASVRRALSAVSQSAAALVRDAPALPLADPERDLVRLALASGGGSDADPWLKVGRLSTFPGDRSLRLRVAYGREGDDDACNDDARNRLVTDLARELLPGGRELLARERLAPLEELSDTALFATQPIAYWNAPDGGARFHHDAFAGAADAQQRAVLYLQLSGATAWLALSISDLALRVRELLADEPGADEGDDPDDGLDRAAWRAIAGDWSALIAELAQPGCGAFGPLVDAPATTAFLADSGHAALLGPGDAIALPNFGLERTAMHSVFCASDRVASGLSLALFEDGERH